MITFFLLLWKSFVENFSLAINDTSIIPPPNLSRGFAKFVEKIFLKCFLKSTFVDNFLCGKEKTRKKFSEFFVYVKYFEKQTT